MHVNIHIQSIQTSGMETTVLYIFMYSLFADSSVSESGADYLPSKITYFTDIDCSIIVFVLEMYCGFFVTVKLFQANG